MRFWDSSAIIPLCLGEPRTQRLKRLAEEDPAFVAWWATPTEYYAVFARLRREAVLSRAEEDIARHFTKSSFP